LPETYEVLHHGGEIIIRRSVARVEMNTDRVVKILFITNEVSQPFGPGESDTEDSIEPFNIQDRGFSVT
jgi:hypothetical protein